MPLMSKPICLYFCYKTAPPNLTTGPACIVSQLVKMSNLEKYVSLSPLHPDFDSHFGVAAKQSSAHCAKSFLGFTITLGYIHPPSEPTSLKLSFEPFLRRCSPILELKVDAQKSSVFRVKPIPILHVAHTGQSLLQLDLKRLVFQLLILLQQQCLLLLSIYQRQLFLC